MTYQNLILGAGPSGLSLNLFLDSPTKIIEMNDHVGGHASSFKLNGFTFDYGPHILFSKHIEILDFIVGSLGGNIQKCLRNNKVSYKDRLIKYPFENDLGSLDHQDNFECIRDFIFNENKSKFPNPLNMKEWLLRTFGESICEKYLFPYNEKVWNIPISDLSMLWAERIPNPPPEDVLKSSIGISTDGYKHQLYYFYPKVGGYQAISDTWGHHSDIDFNEEVIKINKGEDGIWIVGTKNNSYRSKKIVSTIPLSKLLNACLDWIPENILNAYEKLIVNPMYVVSIGIKGADSNQYTAIYFPEKEFLVNRISFPTTFSDLNAPPGCYSIQAEITFAKNSSASNLTDDEIKNHVIQHLNNKKLINGEILFVDVKRCEESYVVYDLNYEKHSQIIRDFFEANNIFLLGRFSFFEYINIDMAVHRALDFAAKLNTLNKATSSILKLASNRLKSNPI